MNQLFGSVCFSGLLLYSRKDLDDAALAFADEFDEDDALDDELQKKLDEALNGLLHVPQPRKAQRFQTTANIICGQVFPQAGHDSGGRSCARAHSQRKCEAAGHHSSRHLGCNCASGLSNCNRSTAHCD